MSRKKCIRKHWRLVNPITHVMEGIQVTPSDVLDQLRVLELSAIESFAKGMAVKSEWDALADMLNVAETMADAGVGPEVLEACWRAQDGLDEARERWVRTKRLGMSGPALQAMRSLYEFHDLQRTSVTRSEYEEFIRKTANRIRSAHPSLKATVTP